VVLNRVFRGQTDGFYIDVGANEPVTDSVTMLFYLRGWSGVNVEPAPGVYGRLAAHRTRDINLNVGLPDREGTLTFHDVPSNQGLSTLSEGLAN
jgi:FkbM family methyltransferase